tara:strand:+ start:561 stop:716 length:156 start_codon:yes stop_codon:yes gene_type:complete
MSGLIGMFASEVSKTKTREAMRKPCNMHAIIIDVILFLSLMYLKPLSWYRV